VGVQLWGLRIEPAYGKYAKPAIPRTITLRTKPT
jgi:hypothetical protein